MAAGATSGVADGVADGKAAVGAPVQAAARRTSTSTPAADLVVDRLSVRHRMMVGPFRRGIGCANCARRLLKPR